MKQACMRLAYRDICFNLSQSKAADTISRCLARSRGLEEAALESCSRKLYQELRMLAPWKPPRDVRLEDSLGNPAGCEGEERTIVRDHFAAQRGAVPYTLEQFILDDRADAILRSPELALVTKTLDAVPSYSSIVTRHSHAKLNGLGELSVGGELNKLLPRTIARMVHPLQVKACIFIRLPVQYRGGAFQSYGKAKALDQLSKAIETSPSWTSTVATLAPLFARVLFLVPPAWPARGNLQEVSMGGALTFVILLSRRLGAWPAL